ncbi:MAG TPA: hypothetical protein VE775_02230, partial [Pyrinomonadaceae bacterium]|nr:hypothetical protein [Pyrinomonadaceae bacterium]
PNPTLTVCPPYKPMRLSKLKDLTAPLTITYHEETITLRYFTEKLFSAEWRERRKNMPEVDADAPQPDAPDENTLALADLIAEWSFADDADAPLPVTIETVHHLRREHPALFVLILQEVTEAIARPLQGPASKNT